MNIVIGTTFIGVLALIVGLYWLFVARGEQAETAELRQRLKHSAGTVAATKKMRLLKPLEQFSSVGVLNGVLSKARRISHPVQRDITQAGLTVSVSTILLAALFLASLVYL